MTPRSRNWLFVLNNYTDEEIEEIKSCTCRYLIFGKEKGEEGTPHLQGYVNFATQRVLAGVKKLLPRAHWDIPNGPPHTQKVYCSKGLQPKAEYDELGVDGPNYGKDADVYETGDLPLSDKEKGKKESDRWEDALKAVQENRLDDIPADILCRNLKQIEYAANRIKVSKRKLETLEGDLEHEWWYGPAGTGKSKKARDDNPGAYIKDPKNAWWDGYDGEEVVIIDDFDKYQVKQSGDLKRWLDRYVYKAECKGGYLGDIRPRKIIITSNYHPKEIWEETDITLSTILRRVKVTKFPATIYTPDPPSPNRFTSLPSRFN